MSKCQQLYDFPELLIKTTSYLKHLGPRDFLFRLADKDECIKNSEDFKRFLSDTTLTDPIQAIVAGIFIHSNFIVIKWIGYPELQYLQSLDYYSLNGHLDMCRECISWSKGHLDTRIAQYKKHAPSSLEPTTVSHLQSPSNGDGPLYRCDRPLDHCCIQYLESLKIIFTTSACKLRVITLL